MQGAQQMDLALGETDVEKLIAYVDYLLLWNKTHNLTAVEDRQKILTHHLLDSLSVTPHIQGATAMDVGSGAGLPGLVLALVVLIRTGLWWRAGARRQGSCGRSKRDWE